MAIRWSQHHYLLRSWILPSVHTCMTCHISPEAELGNKIESCIYTLLKENGQDAFTFLSYIGNDSSLDPLLMNGCVELRCWAEAQLRPAPIVTKHKYIRRIWRVAMAALINERLISGFIVSWTVNYTFRKHLAVYRKYTYFRCFW